MPIRHNTHATTTPAPPRPQADAVSKKREGYAEGEVSMINVLRKDNQEEKRHLHLEERLVPSGGRPILQEGGGGGVGLVIVSLRPHYFKTCIDKKKSRRAH